MKTNISLHPQQVIKFAKWILPLFFAFVMNNQVTGQRNYPPEIDSDTVFIYKSVGNVDLNLWGFYNSRHQFDFQAPAIVFFFGGGWNGGSPEQFVPQCEYLADRGMVAFVADYRVASRHNVKANSCVEDAKSAVRWIRQHASELGIDPEKIAAGGGSAGGHLAAATATLPKFDAKAENIEVSSVPNALVLFNPALILAPTGIEAEAQREKLERLEKRLGSKGEDMSPYHHIVPGLPPTTIFHGTDDKIVPYKSVEAFLIRMNESGNQCSLVAYENEGHGFFNHGNGTNGCYVSTTYLMDQFFIRLNWLSKLPEPDIQL